jgi:hypothetical protein
MHPFALAWIVYGNTSSARMESCGFYAAILAGLRSGLGDALDPLSVAIGANSGPLQ